MHNTTLSEFYSNPNIINGSTYLIKLEMVDGSAQIIQITKEQAIALGIEFGDENPTQEELLNVKDEEDAPINIEDLNKNSNTKTTYNYKVIQPEDLNLQPRNPTPIKSIPLPRGRPKKRPLESPIEDKRISTPKLIKQCRTRSGRITRPPLHMEKHFEKIIIEEDRNEAYAMSKDISTREFEPLKTNNTLIAEPKTQHLIENKKKRSIPAQYRCSTCNKAYLGRNRMAHHLKQHPDHGAGQQLSMEDCEAWSCLIETSLKAKEGHKGTKFCKEILNLISNARTLVKYFFKPAKLGRVDYYVDTLLSSILNIKEGNYRFNENELCKDISIFSFLEYFDDNFADHILKFEEKEKPKIHFGTDIMDVIKDSAPKSEKYVINKPLAKDILHNKVEEQNFLFDCNNLYLEKTVENKKSSLPYLEKSKDKERNDFTNLFLNDGKEKMMNVFCDSSKSESIKENKNNFNLFSCHEIFNDKKDESKVSEITELFQYADVKTTQETDFNKQGKELDIYRNIIPNILTIGASQEHMIDILSEKTDKKDCLDQKREIDIQKLHLLSADISDELILPDPGHVSGILDTSINSDDIMNVDQFVNERFKKLTEADGGEIPNPTISLDLPTLECFNFNGG